MIAQTESPLPRTTVPCSGEYLLKNSSLYREYLAEREEIDKHKWIESEKAGYDLGFDWALTDWCAHHRQGWRAARLELLRRN